MKKILIMMFTGPYKDVLGFKGGTLAYLFYNLPRFSTDLDIDLIDPSKEQEVIEYFNQQLPVLGETERPMLGRDLHRWKFNYNAQSRNIKIELNKRQSTHTTYERKSIENILIQCQSLESMATNKLLALGNRRYNRDLYDIHFFLSQGYQFNKNIIIDKTDQTLISRINIIIQKIPDSFQENTILHQLGEVLDTKQKPRAKTHLANETIKLLQQYLSKYN